MYGECLVVTFRVATRVPCAEHVPAMHGPCVAVSEDL